MPSASSEEPSVAGPSSSVAGSNITPLGPETSDAAAERSGSEEEESASPRTPQEILRDLPKTVWILSTKKKSSIYPYFCVIT